MQVSECSPSRGTVWRRHRRRDGPGLDLSRAVNPPEAPRARKRALEARFARASPRRTGFRGDVPSCSNPRLAGVNPAAVPERGVAPSGSSLRSRQSETDWFSGRLFQPSPCRSESCCGSPSAVSRLPEARSRQSETDPLSSAVRSSRSPFSRCRCGRSDARRSRRRSPAGSSRPSAASRRRPSLRTRRRSEDRGAVAWSSADRSGVSVRRRRHSRHTDRSSELRPSVRAGLEGA